ncbi:MAG: hypothetical protein AAFX03_03405 [Pseudomonadota bacterium]
MTEPVAWKPIGRVARDRLVHARLIAHHALQPLAGAARTRLPPAPDDSHTSLTWRGEEGALATGAFPGGPAIAFRVRDLNFTHDGAAFDPAGRTQGEISAWLAERLDLGDGAAAGLTPPPYDMPAHPVADGAVIDTAPWRAELLELSNWFANAHACLTEAVTGLEGVHEVSPARCWPHHFDIAALVSLEPQTGEDSKSVNAGLSPGDESYDQPYFYVSPWPYPDPAALADLPVGAWRTDGFTAAILTAVEISNAADSGEAAAMFLKAAIDTSRKALA